MNMWIHFVKWCVFTLANSKVGRCLPQIFKIRKQLTINKNILSLPNTSKGTATIAACAKSGRLQQCWMLLDVMEECLVARHRANVGCRGGRIFFLTNICVLKKAANISDAGVANENKMGSKMDEGSYAFLLVEMCWHFCFRILPFFLGGLGDDWDWDGGSAEWLF